MIMTTTTALRTETVSADPKYWDCPTLDTDQHISESLGKPLALPESVDSDQWATEQDEALCRWFAQLGHQQYEQAARDNTYNQENDLSSNYVYSVFAPVDCSDWLWCDDVFVVIETHLGGDVRGNYGPLAVYRVDQLAETGFFDLVCGWYASPINSDSFCYQADCENPELQAANDRLSVGYSSHPTSEVHNLLWQGTEPTWSERLGCYVARLADVPFAVCLVPTEPYYAA